jgi:hypothetical protein
MHWCRSFKSKWVKKCITNSLQNCPHSFSFYIWMFLLVSVFWKGFCFFANLRFFFGYLGVFCTYTKKILCFTGFIFLIYLLCNFWPLNFLTEYLYFIRASLINAHFGVFLLKTMISNKFLYYREQVSIISLLLICFLIFLSHFSY